MSKEQELTSVFSIEERKDIFNQLNETQQKIKTLESKKIQTSRELKELIPVSKPQEPEEEFNFAPIKYTGIVAAIIVIILFVFHCLIWILKLLFSISWDTWGWTKTAFWWGLGITIAVAIYRGGRYGFDWWQYDKLYEKYKHYIKTKTKLENQMATHSKDIRKLKEDEEIIKLQYSESLAKDYRNILGIPIDDYAIAYEERSDAENMMLRHYELSQKAISCSDVSEKLKLKEEIVISKLILFYRWSIKGETVQTYPTFESQLKQAQQSKNWELLREEIKDELANLHWNKLKEYTSLLNDNKMTPFINELEAISQVDTKTGLLGGEDVNALAEKTKMLQHLFKAAKNEYKELAELNNNISYLLEFVRVMAYRNIYLSAELLNYIRDNAGGKSLTTEKGMLDLKIDFKNINSSMAVLKMDVVGNISTTVANYIDKGRELLDNKDIVNFISKNPKTAAAAGGIIFLLSAIGNIVEERNAKINNNLKIQKAAIENIQKMVDNYTNGQGALLRAIEIIKAISKANNGFLQIYEPLRQQVYDNKNIESVTITDVQQLVIATNEYNKISKAKL